MAELARVPYAGTMRLAVPLLLLSMALLNCAFAAECVTGVARVIDGDTIEISETRVRLWGIDSPELAQRCTKDGALYPCGFDASRALAKLIRRKSVSCARRDTDHYGRMVALCRIEGLDLSRWMVEQGQAIAYRKYSLDYVPDEQAARAAHRGLWAGEFQNPADFRHDARREPVAVANGPKPNAAAARHDCACPRIETAPAGDVASGAPTRDRVALRGSAPGDEWVRRIEAGVPIEHCAGRIGDSLRRWSQGRHRHAGGGSELNQRVSLTAAMIR